MDIEERLALAQQREDEERQDAANFRKELQLKREYQENPQTRALYSDLMFSGLRGTIKAARSFYTGIRDIAEAAPTPFFQPIYMMGQVKKQVLEDHKLQTLVSGKPDTRDDVEKLADAALDTLPESTTTFGKLYESTAQFIAGLLPVMRVTKAVSFLQGTGRAITAVRGIVEGAAVSGLAFEGHEGNLANVAKEFGIENEVTDFLATDEEDPELVGRLKNAVTDAGAGALFEGFLSSLRLVKNFRKVKLDELKTETGFHDAPTPATAEPDEAPVELTLAPADEPIPTVQPRVDENALAATHARADKLSLEGEAVVDPVVAKGEAAAAKAEEIAQAATEEVQRSKPQPLKELSPDEQYAKMRQRLGITEDKLDEFRKLISDGKAKPEDIADLIGANPDRIDWSNVTDAEDMVGLMNSLSRILGDAVGEAAGYSRVSLKEIAEQMSRIGGSMDDAIRTWESTRNLASHVQAGRAAVLGSGSRLKNLAKKIASGDYAPQDLLDFATHDRRHALLQTMVRGTRAEIGRALRVMREGMGVNEAALKLASGRQQRVARQAAEAAQKVKAEVAARKEATKAAEAAKAKAAAAEQKAQSLEEMVKAAREGLDAAHDARMASEVKAAKAAQKEAAKQARAEAREAAKEAARLEKEAAKFENLNAKDFDKQIGADVNLTGDIKLQFSEVKQALANMGHRPEDVEQLAKLAAESKDIDAFARSSMRENTIISRLASLYINNILSGLPTMALNVSSGFYKVVETAVENFGQLALGSIRGADRFERMVALKGTIAAMTAWRGAWKAAREAWKEGLPQTDVLARHEVAARGGSVITGHATTDAVLTAPSRAIMTIDEFFKHIFYQQELTARSVEVAASAARLQPTRALQDKMYAKVLKETMESPPDDLVLDAVEAARYNTFQSDLESSFAKWLQNGTNQVPILRFVIPFIKTPLNILKQGIIERTPLALASTKLRKQMLAGGREGRTAMFRMMLGTSAVALTWEAAGNGTITGSTRGQRGNKNSADLTDVPAYSKKIGDKWYQYNRLDPIGTVIGLTVDLRQAYDALVERSTNNLETDDPKITEAFGNILAIINENLTDKTFFKGLSDAINAVSGEDNAADYYFTNLSSNMVPMSSLLRNISKAHDDLAREAWTHMDKVLAGIPGQSEDLPARRDVLGRPMKNADRVGPDWVSPFLVSTQDKDPVAKAFADLKMSYRMPPKDIAGVPLDAKQYSRLLEVRGQFIYNNIKEWMSAGDWEGLTKYQRQDVVRRWFTQGSHKAEATVLQEWPQLGENVERFRQEARAKKTGEIE